MFNSKISKIIYKAQLSTNKKKIKKNQSSTLLQLSTNKSLDGTILSNINTI